MLHSYREAYQANSYILLSFYMYLFIVFIVFIVLIICIYLYLLLQVHRESLNDFFSLD
jgi:heme/copper-type cytochrome/quinol oxidase subunit 2